MRYVSAYLKKKNKQHVNIFNIIYNHIKRNQNRKLSIFHINITLNGICKIHVYSYDIKIKNTEL